MVELAAAIVGLFEVVIPTVSKLMNDIVSRKAEFKNQVGTMETQLGFVKAGIQDLSKLNMNQLTKELIQKLRCLAYDLEDCIESFKEVKRSSKLEEKIGKLNGQLDQIMNCYKRFGIDGASSSSTRVKTSCNPPSRQQDQSIPLVDLVSKNENLCELLDLMRPSNSELKMELKVIVISIVGFVERTLLANQVYEQVVDYSQSLLNNKFSRHVLIDATAKDKEQVIQDILEKLWKQGNRQDGRGMRASNKGRQQVKTGVLADPGSSDQSKQYMNEDMKEDLRSCIGENRYLIVVDNVQSEEIGKYITSVFPENNKASRIIITMTVEGSDRMESSGPAAGHVCKMMPLKSEESANKFLKQALKGGQPHIATEEAASVPSPTIRKICDGVPLALVSISEVEHRELWQFNVREAWKELSREAEAQRWLSRMDQHVLPHCYDSLCTHRQACLLYFAMFPRGCTVTRGSLIRRWEAEGPDLKCTKNAKATANLEALIKRNFVWPVQLSMNNRDAEPQVKSCHYPELMFDYVIDKSKLEEFIMLACDDGDPEVIRRLSLHTGNSSSDDGELMLSNMSHLRTLAIFHANQQIASGLHFKECGVLRVLDLKTCRDLSLSDHHLREICDFLELLKYLSLPPCINTIPPYIAKLKLLQTLELGKETVVTVPADVLMLPNLKHLLGKCELCGDYSSHKELIKFLSGPGEGETNDESSKLETLAGFVIGKKKGFPQLVRHMAKLRKVKIWFNPDADSKKKKRRYNPFADPKSNADYLADGIKEFFHRRSANGVGNATLKIDLQNCSHNLLDSVGVTGCKLFYLKVSCFDETTLTQVPKFIVNLGVITNLCLSWITLDGSKILDKLGNLEGLRYLKLVADHIKGSVGAQEEIVINPEPKFQSLQRMCLIARKTMHRITIEPGALMNLVSLHLIYKDLHGSSAKQINSLKTLKEVALHPLVKSETKDAWRRAAQELPIKPQVLFSKNP